MDRDVIREQEQEAGGWSFLYVISTAVLRAGWDGERSVLAKADPGVRFPHQRVEMVELCVRTHPTHTHPDLWTAPMPVSWV